MMAEPKECEPSKDFKRFEELTKKLVSVPKKDIQKEENVHKKKTKKS